MDIPSKERIVFWEVKRKTKKWYDRNEKNTVVIPLKAYEEFSYIYSKGPYTSYSQKMAMLFFPVLDLLDFEPKKLLDIACGEGTFAVEMAKEGLEVTGIDRSARMLELAQKKAKEEKVAIDFVLGDMTRMKFDGNFDTATCWFDSMNYVLKNSDLKKVFSGVHAALEDGGLFIFDMNTIHGLVTNWHQSTYIQQNTDDIFEAHSTDYDFERNIATLEMTGFVRKNDSWKRIKEIHTERGYTFEEIRKAFKSAGFSEIACWESLKMMNHAEPDSNRVFFILKK